MDKCILYTVCYIYKFIFCVEMLYSLRIEIGIRIIIIATTKTTAAPPAMRILEKIVCNIRTSGFSFHCAHIDICLETFLYFIQLDLILTTVSYKEILYIPYITLVIAVAAFLCFPHIHREFEEFSLADILDCDFTDRTLMRIEREIVQFYIYLASIFNQIKGLFCHAWRFIKKKNVRYWRFHKKSIFNVRYK